MPSAARLAPSRRPHAAGVPAVVSKAPATAADTVDVDWTSIDDEDGDEKTITETCLWVRRGTALPTEGDSALLLLDTIGDPWALVF